MAMDGLPEGVPPPGSPDLGTAVVAVQRGEREY